MQTIAIQDKYFEALKLFGETDELVETALLFSLVFLLIKVSIRFATQPKTFLFKRKVWLRRFIVEQATDRIKALRDEVKIWEEIYGESFN